MESDLTRKTKSSVEKISENFYMLGNEPCLACFRISEHVTKNGPQVQDLKTDMKKLHAELQGACFDMDYTIEAVNLMYPSLATFKRIRETLTNAYFHKQQINYINSKMRASQKIPQHKKNPFQRFSGSFDIHVPSIISHNLPTSPSTSTMSAMLNRTETSVKTQMPTNTEASTKVSVQKPG